MPVATSSPTTRVRAVASHLAGPLQAKVGSKQKRWEQLPLYDDLPMYKNFPGCAWSVWGEGDELGTVNLLTPEAVREAAKEISTGHTVCLNWPINFPSEAMFGRKAPEINVVQVSWEEPVKANWQDDEIHINPQSGSQWDGLKHCGIHDHDVFYGNTPKTHFKGGKVEVDIDNVDQEQIKYGIHNWAQHGICGRGVLLDMVRFFSKNGAMPLSYDPWSDRGFSVAELQACAEAQGVEFRHGDILIIRVGFTKRFTEATKEERRNIGGNFAGVEQGEEMKRFLWNHHFSAIASDSVTLERWPAQGQMLHQTFLGLWGMPMGEMWDLERLAEICASAGRYSFFFTSWPINALGGVSSPANAAAYF